MQGMRSIAFMIPLVVDASASALVITSRGACGIVLHLLAMALAFAITCRTLRDRSAHGAALSATLLVLALPVVGAAVLALVAWPSWARELEASAPALVEVTLPDGSASDEPVAVEQPGGPRPIRELLRKADSPAERVRAVMALRHMDARRAVPLLRLAFAHESEDVRLLAFGILEQREKRLRTRIEQTEARLSSATGSLARARAHRRLARDHWELVYAGFVSGDLEPIVLKSAERHAHEVLTSASDAGMAVLLARIQLRQREPEQAWAWLARAEEAGLARASAAPLFAEAAFLMRRFDEIPAILRGVPRAELRRPELEPVAEFWTSEA